MGRYFKLVGRIPRETFTLACSGGKDSMVFLDFLLKFPQNKIEIAYFNHGTQHGADAESFVKEFAHEKGLKLRLGKVMREKRSGESPEEYWREQRYNFLNQIQQQVITGHHLNDVMETWVFSSLRGLSKVIPYQRENVIRPFLKVSREEIDNWAVHNCVRWIEDPSNEDVHYTRNAIRHELMPLALKVNPGLGTMLRKKIESRCALSKE